jgi:hypothetical protein
MSRWDEDHWSEVLCFLLGIISQTADGASISPSESVDLILNGPNGENAGLFLFLALGEGAALHPELEERLIEKLIMNTRMVGGEEDCCDYVNGLERQGKSPIQILQRLSDRPRVKKALEDLARDPSLCDWMRDKAVNACQELGI